MTLEHIIELSKKDKMLGSSQRMTLIHLRTINGLITPQEVVDWCKKKIVVPRYVGGMSRTNSRKRNASHYQRIVDYIEGLI